MTAGGNDTLTTPFLTRSSFFRPPVVASKMPRTFAVYIMASRRNGTLYIGVTNNLSLRAHQHRTGAGSVFTTKYGVTRLVRYEFYDDVNEAIAREKQLKKWRRRWKLELIESFNPAWADLYETLNQ